ncbi:MAG: EamA family transporter RarD [Bowdeniella nasicola]|nr:EamA family transporter RarD [Bowdeniella nasicola]
MATRHQPMVRSGIAASLSSSAMFALLAYYADILTTRFGPWEIFGWRLLLTFPALTVILLATQRGPRIWRFLQHIWDVRWKIPVLLLNAVLLIIQMVLFTWAPGVGRTVELSLGYFLMPLVMIVIGRVGFRETVSRGQAIATVLAAVGVAHEIWRAGGLGWPTLVVAIGYPAYFVSRRISRMASAAALWCEMGLAVPVSLLLVASPSSLGHAANPSGIALILGLGFLSAGAMATYAAAQVWLPFALFGLLAYLEPVLLVVVAFTLLGEGITSAELPTYALIWIAVVVLAVDGAIRAGRTKKRGERWWPDIG